MPAKPPLIRKMETVSSSQSGARIAMNQMEMAAARAKAYIVYSTRSGIARRNPQVGGWRSAGDAAPDAAPAGRETVSKTCKEPLLGLGSGTGPYVRRAFSREYSKRVSGKMRRHAGGGQPA